MPVQSVSTLCQGDPGTVKFGYGLLMLGQLDTI